MVAAAALIGWATVVYRSQRLRPSRFFQENENWQAEVAAVFQELGEPAFTGAAGTVMHSEGTAANQRTFVAHLPLPHDKIGSFLALFVKQIRTRVTAAGCKTAGEAAGIGAGHAQVIGYTSGPVSGIVQVYVSEAGPDRATVILNMQEQRGESADFGIIIRGE
jgi:hypothetical protein